mgnify:CR=1 FL=1
MYPIRLLLTIGRVLVLVVGFTALVFPGGTGGAVILVVCLIVSVILGKLSRKVRF